MLTDDDLRLELGYLTDEWSADDAQRAERILERSRSVVRSMVGASRFDHAETTQDEGKLAAIDEATLVLAISRFENPERVMQRRQGSDNSVSYADSSDAAGGRREAQDILRGAFGMRAGTTTL